MRFTISIKKNKDFRRLYHAGHSAVGPFVAVYCRKNRTDKNRLGITVGTKVGKAVCRNRVRRRLREAYRLMEDKLVCGYDIVIVARVRCAGAEYSSLSASLNTLFSKLGVMKDEVNT